LVTKERLREQEGRNSQAWIWAIKILTLMILALIPEKQFLRLLDCPQNAHKISVIFHGYGFYRLSYNQANSNEMKLESQCNSFWHS
jgi:hypothetical protein